MVKTFQHTFIQALSNISYFGIGLLVYVVLLSIRVAFFETPLRWGIYLLPVVIGALVVLHWRQKQFVDEEGLRLFRQYFAPLLALYGAMVVISFFVHLSRDGLITRYFEEAVFILTPLLAAGLLFLLPREHERERYVPPLLLAYCLIFFINIDFNLSDFLLSVEQVFGRLLSLDLSVTVGVPTESNLVYFFALLMPYFALKRRWILLGIATFFMLLSYRRMMIAAVVLIALAAPVLYVMYTRLKQPGRWIVLLAVLVNIVFVVLTIQIGREAFDEFMLETTGSSLNYWLSGRPNLYGVILEGFGIQQFNVPILGVGLGSITPYLEQIEANLINPHSDLLKVLLESGPVLFLVWIFVFYRVHAHTFAAVLLAINLNLYWLVNNSFIFADVLFLFYVLVAFFILDHWETEAASVSQPIETSEYSDAHPIGT